MFKPFVDEGYVAFVYGGGEEGKYLCTNPAVESIHLTGSEATYDAIVWGPGKPKVSSANLQVTHMQVQGRCAVVLTNVITSTPHNDASDAFANIHQDLNNHVMYHRIVVHSN